MARLLVCTAAAAGALAALAPPAAHTDHATPAVQRVDGHGVKWWAARARANRAAMRWQRRARRNLQRTLRARVRLTGALADGFLCIHRYEGPWTAATGNGFYGGLQMDASFMRAYGREFLAAYGTADRWPPFVQVAVAMRAYLSGRGFGPWPSTRHLCGL